MYYDCPASSRALIVDLDETASRTDTLHEALLYLVLRKPRALLWAIKSLRSGKAAFKSFVADQYILPARGLAYNPEVMGLVEEAVRLKRNVVLVSGSDHRQVSAVVEHLGCFDEAIGTGSNGEKGKNLTGQQKAEYLVARYGEKQYDYVGDCELDIPVWKASRIAYAVSPSRRLIAQAAAYGIDLVPVGKSGGTNLRDYLRAMRPHQWVKNILVFLPMLAAQQTGQVGSTLLAFVLFCMAASGIYIFNDLADLASDREHPRKKLRPFAAGRIPIHKGLMQGMALAGVSIILSMLAMNAAFTMVLVLYLLATSAYSFSLKKKLIVDVVTLAVLYTLRIIAGAAAVGIMLSPWLLAFSVFIFFALAAVKRQAELIDLSKRSKTSSAGRGYLAGDVNVMQALAISSGHAAVLVFALYLDSDAVRSLYASPEVLWAICPIMIYWLARVSMLTHRGYMHDDPIVFAARDTVSLATFAAILPIVLAAEYGIWNEILR